jgi:hypothetical protein
LLLFYCNLIASIELVAPLHHGQCCHYGHSHGTNEGDEPVVEKGKKAKRSLADLPPELLHITEQNIFQLCVIGDEYYTEKKSGEHTGPHKVIQFFKHLDTPPAAPPNDSVGTAPGPIVYLEYPTEKLTSDQFHGLLKNLSVKGYASATKFK